MYASICLEFLTESLTSVKLFIVPTDIGPQFDSVSVRKIDPHLFKLGKAVLASSYNM